MRSKLLQNFFLSLTNTQTYNVQLTSLRLLNKTNWYTFWFLFILNWYFIVWFLFIILWHYARLNIDIHFYTCFFARFHFRWESQSLDNKPCKNRCLIYFWRVNIDDSTNFAQNYYKKYSVIVLLVRGLLLHSLKPAKNGPNCDRLPFISGQFLVPKKLYAPIKTHYVSYFIKLPPRWLNFNHMKIAIRPSTYRCSVPCKTDFIVCCVLFRSL